MARYIFSLNITPEEYQKLYAGTATAVYAYSIDGRRVQFPASILKPFVSRTGVHGVFSVECDQNNRFIGVSKIG